MGLAAPRTTRKQFEASMNFVAGKMTERDLLSIKSNRLAQEKRFACAHPQELEFVDADRSRARFQCEGLSETREAPGQTLIQWAPASMGKRYRIGRQSARGAVRYYSMIKRVMGRP